MPGVVQTAKGLERNIADFLRRMATLGFEPRYMPTGSLNPDSLPIYNRSHISSPGQFILSGEWVFVEKVSTHADTGSDSVGAYIRAAADSATFVPKEDMDFFDTNDGQTLALARDDAEQRLTDIEAQISRTKAQKIRLFGSREDELKRLEQEKATRIDARDSAKTLADIHQSIHAAINLRKASLSDSKNPRVITNPDLLHKESFWQKMAESMGLNPNQVRLESMAEFMLVLKTGSPDRADSFRKGNHGVWL